MSFNTNLDQFSMKEHLNSFKNRITLIKKSGLLKKLYWAVASDYLGRDLAHHTTTIAEAKGVCSLASSTIIRTIKDDNFTIYPTYLDVVQPFSDAVLKVTDGISVEKIRPPKGFDKNKTEAYRVTTYACSAQKNMLGGKPSIAQEYNLEATEVFCEELQEERSYI